jgi:hypothetical protein
VVVDLARCDDDDGVHCASVGDALRSALTSSGYVALANHGVESALQRMRDACRDHYHLDSGTVPKQKFELGNVEGGEPLRSLLAGQRGLVSRLCQLLFGPELETELHRRGEMLDGRISLRFYPKIPLADQSKATADPSTKVILGAHVDANLMTLLWSDGPGLQVLCADTADSESGSGDGADGDSSSSAPAAAPLPLDPDQVCRFGIPSMGPSDLPELTDANFADVLTAGAADDPDPDPADLWQRDMLLLSVGEEWTRRGVPECGMPAAAPVLHRVRLAECARHRDRHSIPYLVRLVDKVAAEAEAKAEAAAAATVVVGGAASAQPPQPPASPVTPEYSPAV